MAAMLFRRKPGKADIVRTLAARFGYRRYLEITTGSTGAVYPAARRAGFAVCRRLVYRLDVSPWDDGEPIDFAVGGDDTREAMALIREQVRDVDVMLVDPHHTYECSLRDIEDAFGLIRDGGALVVHDCDPPNAAMAAPDYVEGAWCGVTYKAFLDFVRDRDDLFYFTVDTDFGCGVILKRHAPAGMQRRVHGLLDAMSGAGDPDLSRQWRAVGDDCDAAFQLFRRNRRALLRLMNRRIFALLYG